MNNEAQSERDIDTLEISDALKEVRANLEMQDRVRNVFAAIVGCLGFVSMVLWYADGPASAKLVTLFTMLFSAIWAMQEIAASRKTVEES